MSALKAWERLAQPGSFSSSDYLARTGKRSKAATKKALSSSVAYAVHRDLREVFDRRSNLASRPNQRWEADLGNMGGRIPPEMGGGGPPGPGRRKALQMLVAVDVFTKAIYAEAVKSKEGSDVAKALERIMIDAGASPEVLATDSGLEFRNRYMTELARRRGMRQSYCRGLHKARNAERAVKAMKKTIMQAVQTDSWPEGETWKEVPRMASAALRGRYNRSLKGSPNDFSLSPRWQELQAKKERLRASFVPPNRYDSDEAKMRSGDSLEDGLAVGDAVLPPIPKTRPGKVKDKDFMMHYSPMPMVVSNIYHARRPYLYELRNPRTGKKEKRFFYAVELKKATLPAPAEEIVGWKMEGGKVKYRLEGGGWAEE